MKKTFIIVLSLMLAISIISCGAKESEAADTSTAIIEEDTSTDNEPEEAEDKLLEENSVAEADPSVDLDLTALTSTMIYSEVFNMIMDPASYEGKTVKMDGSCNVYVDEETGKTYYACIVKDATQCCSQGLEFVLDDSIYTQADYPSQDDEIIIKGTFSSYEENGYQYITMKDSVLE